MLQIGAIQAIEDREGEFVLRGTESRNPDHCTFYGRITGNPSHRKQDAQDIVRSVNAHDQLVAALKEAKDFLEVHDAARGNTYSDIVEALAAAGAA